MHGRFFNFVRFGWKLEKVLIEFLSIIAESMNKKYQLEGTQSANKISELTGRASSNTDLSIWVLVSEHFSEYLLKFKSFSRLIQSEYEFLLGSKCSNFMNTDFDTQKNLSNY